MLITYIPTPGTANDVPNPVSMPANQSLIYPPPTIIIPTVGTANDVPGGVAEIVAGSNITVSPPAGVGIVTVSSTGGGSGSTAQVSGGSGPPVSNPSNTAVFNVYVDITNSVVYWWYPGSQSWN